MRGEKMLAVLEVLSDIPEEALAALAAFLSAGYGASASRIKYQKDSFRSLKRVKVSIPPEELQRYRNLLSYLKKDGLIERDGSKISITRRGKDKVSVLKKKSFGLPDKKKYKKIVGEKVIIVSFDVPEKMRVKRGWLRDVLQNLGFDMVQQSVFVGRGTLPQDFLRDIKELGLIKAVEIFEINKTGTLRNIL